MKILRSISGMADRTKPGSNKQELEEERGCIFLFLGHLVSSNFIYFCWVFGILMIFCWEGGSIPEHKCFNLRGL